MRRRIRATPTVAHVHAHAHTHCVRETRTRGRGRSPSPSLPLLPSSGTRSPRERTRAVEVFDAMVCVHPVCDPSSLWPGSCHEKTESRPFAALAKRERVTEKEREIPAVRGPRGRSPSFYSTFRKTRGRIRTKRLSCSRSLNRDRGRILGRGAA